MIYVLFPLNYLKPFFLLKFREKKKDKNSVVSSLS